MTETIRDVNGNEWQLGCLPRETKVLQCDAQGNVIFPEYGTEGTPPLISNAKLDRLDDVISPRLIWHIINQSNQGSCCACMIVAAIMLLRVIAGLKKIILSQASLYALGNGGRDQGMAVDTGLRVAMETGPCPIDVIDQYDWQGYQRRTWPEDYKVHAKRYQILKGWDCLTYQHIRSAYKRGHPVCCAANGHAFLRIGDDLDVNSHGRGFGTDGIGKYASARDIERQLPMYGAFVPWLVVDPVNDGDLPQPS